MRSEYRDGSINDSVLQEFEYAGKIFDAELRDIKIDIPSEKRIETSDSNNVIGAESN